MSGAPLNQQPTGLLEFLGIKNGGKYPQTFGEQLSPQWNLENWYLTQRAQLLTVNGTVAAVGYTLAFQVPQNAVWFVWNMATRALTAAGEAITFQNTISRNPNVNTLPVSDYVIVGASAAGSRTTLLNQYYGPDSNFGMYVAQITTAGAVAVSYHIRYTEMLL